VKRVLVVDDNADNRYSLRLLLDGYEITEAASGEEALASVREVRPDCVLLDVAMPGMDGFEVCRRFRADDRMKTVPIILVTAHHRDTDSVVKGLAAGADEYVTKPVAQEELLARVRAMLRIHELQERLETLNRELESKVERRTAELQQIYATVPVGIYTLDATGHFTSFNHHLQDMLGYDENDVVGKLSIGDVFSDGYDTVYWLDVCRREGRTACEGVARRKDGRVVPVYDERVVRIDPVGEHEGFTGYMQDFTQQRRLRDILKEQEAQAAVGRLTAGIVHEIANPVSGVTQWLDAMLLRLERDEDPASDELRRGAEVMRDALRRTTDLIRNLRGFTRSAVRPASRVDLRALLDDLHALMRHDLRKRGIDMTVTGEVGRTVQGDAGRLTQVFLNLITNARDAMPDGGSLAAEVHAEDSAVLVRVRDTGVGIPPENMDRLFDFLFTTKGDEGTGYGLTISGDIVEEHGGRIEVESEPGKGSTFTVILPRAGSGPPVA